MYIPIYTLLPHVECTIKTVYSHNIIILYYNQTKCHDSIKLHATAVTTGLLK